MEVILEQLKIRIADFAKIISNLSLNVLNREKLSVQNKSGRLTEEM